MTEFAALKAARATGGDWGDFAFNGSPKCPHCGSDCHIRENEWWDLYEEGEHTKECPHCDGEFVISTRVSYSFSTDQQEDWLA